MRFTLVFILALCTSILQSQEATITYLNRVVTDTTQIHTFPPEIQKMFRKNMEGENYYLLIKDGKSLYTSDIQKELLLKKEFGEDPNTINQSIQHPYSEIIFSNFNEKKRISKVTHGGISYNIEENLLESTWNKRDERMTINGYDCSLAETTIYGKTVKVWYTESIKLPYGPSWYQGLPGLIIQIEYGKRIITATAINYSMFQPLIAPNDGLSISREEFDALINKAYNVKEGETYEDNGSETIIKKVIKH